MPGSSVLSESVSRPYRSTHSNYMLLNAERKRELIHTRQSASTEPFAIRL
jgi:hypothetical protein